MSDQPDPIKQLPPQHEDIVRSTWAQLLGAEGSVQNLAVDLVKSLVKTQLGGEGGSAEPSAPPAGDDQAHAGGGESTGRGAEGGNNDLFYQLGGLAGQFLGTRRDGGGSGGGGGGDLMGQLGGLAGQFLGGGRSQLGEERPANSEGNSTDTPRSGGGGGSLMDTLGGLGSLARQFGGGSGGGGGGGNIMQLIGSLGGMAALAQGLHDPGKLLSFFMKTPVAQDAGNPDNSSRDIYKIIKGVIFNLLGSKLPEEDFNQNAENKSAWKGYLGMIAKALRNFAQ
ncbi:calpain clp-1-like isoform X3 [Paramacrobiotus metropolitanus]|uniref:calpain clp-1-like isoform X3 n=1 Tax=Paramacrobiotus metropolitanus TaxID=2943436 RepID=UPI002445C868|nr:calpain clp-1-like isoform X3 [Paramacrobiotus metropolitanus]